MNFLHANQNDSESDLLLNRIKNKISAILGLFAILLLTSCGRPTSIEPDVTITHLLPQEIAIDYLKTIEQEQADIPDSQLPAKCHFEENAVSWWDMFHFEDKYNDLTYSVVLMGNGKNLRYLIRVWGTFTFCQVRFSPYEKSKVEKTATALQSLGVGKR